MSARQRHHPYGPLELLWRGDAGRTVHQGLPLSLCGFAARWDTVLLRRPVVESVVTPPFCLCCQGYAHPGVSAPAAASGGGGGDVSGAVVGSLVVLAPDYASYSDASGGPLSLGQVGVVVQTSSTRLQVKVNPSGDRVWWYVCWARRCGACAIHTCVAVM